MFAEAFIRCHKIYFFSWSSVDFVLYLHNGIVINSVKINSFRNILSNKYVRMFKVPFLPRAIRVCKVYVSFHHCAADFVFGALCPIVSSYSPNLLSIRKSNSFLHLQVELKLRRHIWSLLEFIQCSHNKKRHTNRCVPFFAVAKGCFLDGTPRNGAAVALARMKFDYFG